MPAWRCTAVARGRSGAARPAVLAALDMKMKRGLRRGILAVLLCELLLEAMLFVTTGGLTEYLLMYSTYQLGDVAVQASISVGAFLVGIVNARLGANIESLLIGMVTVPIVYYVSVFVVVIFAFGSEFGPVRFVLIPVLTTAVSMVPTLLASALQVKNTR